MAALFHILKIASSFREQQKALAALVLALKI